MPDVRLPNGKIIKGVPEGTPKDEIMQKAINAGLATKQDFMPASQAGAGDAEQIRKALFPTFAESVAESFTGASRQTPEAESLPELGEGYLSTPPAVFTQRTIEGKIGVLKEEYPDAEFRQDAKGNVIVKIPEIKTKEFDLSQIGDRTADAIESQMSRAGGSVRRENGKLFGVIPSQEYIIDKPGLSPTDIKQTVADVAAFTPAGRAAGLAGSIGGKMIAGGLASAGTEAAIQGAGEIAGGKQISPVDVTIAGTVGAVAEPIAAIPSLIKGMRKGEIPQEAAEAIAQAEQRGTRILTSDVIEANTKPKAFFQTTAESIPIVGTSSIKAAQQKARVEAVDEAIQKYGEFSYEAIVDSLKSKKDTLKNAAGKRIGEAADNLDAILLQRNQSMPINNAAKAIDDALEVVTNPALIENTKVLNDLNKVLDSVINKPQTYSTLQQNRSAIKEMVDSIDPAARAQMGSRGRALLARVESAIKKDMDEFAKSNLTSAQYKGLQRANQRYFDEAQDLTRTRLKTILDKGDVNPEIVEGMLFSRKPSEVAKLYKSLTNEGRKNARSAIISKVTDTLSRRASGITPTAFVNELKKYPAQTQAFFKGGEQKYIKGLARFLDATKAAQNTNLVTQTGQQVVGGGVILGSPFVSPELAATALSVGSIARIYESAPIRNLMLKLSNAPKGSKLEKELIEQIKTLGAGVIQSTKNEENKQ